MSDISDYEGSGSDSSNSSDYESEVKEVQEDNRPTAGDTSKFRGPTNATYPKVLWIPREAQWGNVCKTDLGCSWSRGHCKRLFHEFIGTMIFLFVIASTIFVPATVGGSYDAAKVLAIGTSLMSVIYMTGNVSGGHVNPAVTVGVWIRGELGKGPTVLYIFMEMVSQIVGGICGVALAYYIVTPNNDANATIAAFKALDFSSTPAAAAGAANAKFSDEQIFMAELFFTFFLVATVLNTATVTFNPIYSTNGFFGLAIGFTQVAASFAIGHVSGACINPAVTLGVALAKRLDGDVALESAGTVCVKLAANFLGGILAGLIFIMNH